MLPLEVVTPVPATGFFTLAWLLIAIPAASSAVLLLVGRRADRWAPYLGAAAPLASFAIGLIYFIQLLGRDTASRAVSVPLYNWISSGIWQIDVGLLIDQLSILFVLLITGVGGLIHVYSVGYMAHDDRRRRFFAFLNLFVAAMLLLVLADNYLVLFVGWEGVGLASYLLIGFWQYKPVAATAAKKAFVVNRVGDMGMSLAIMLMLATFGSSAFLDVNAGMPDVSGTTALIMGLAAAARCLWQVGPGAAAVVAIGRDGGSDSGVCVDPCSHHGDGWGLPDHPEQRGLRGVGGSEHGGSGGRHGDAAVRRLDWLRQGRHQEGAGRLDDVPDRLHDAGGGHRARRLCVRDLPSAHPWVLQGRHVPRGRLGDARDQRRGRYATLRGPEAADADHLLHLCCRLFGDHRVSVHLRLLFQGPHHRGCL